MKDKLIALSTYFYQGKIKEGMEQVMPVVTEVSMMPELTPILEYVLDALDKQDYVMAADILYYEMAMKL